MKQHVMVLGAGITGVTTAYALARQGHHVTVVDRQRYPAMDTSFANGGQLSASNAEVWTHWSTLLKGLRWMARRDAPLLIHPAPTWHKLRWFAEFMAQIPHYRANTIETARLAISARHVLFDWADREGIDFCHRREGILHVYRDRAGFEHAAKVTRLLAEAGLERRAVTPAEMRAIEPTLHGRFHGGFFTESDSTGDIHLFTTGLAQAAARLGVEFRMDTEVTRLKWAGQVRATLHSRGTHITQAFDAVVVCAGAASPAFAAQVGDSVNIYPVKGYSITVNLSDAASQSAAPRVSLLDDETKLVSSRLGVDRFRVAGTAEFCGFNRDIRQDRIQPLIRWVEQCFPGVSTRSVVPWAGLRPMTPSMLPRVGRGRHENVFYNTGHGHLGWTLSAATADMVSQLISTQFAAKLWPSGRVSEAAVSPGQ